MVISPPPVTGVKPARVLIVEDEGIIAGHIASGLLKTGYSVAGIAESSEEALETARDLNPDLILMDIRIKGALDGIGTALKLRETFDIPVVYLTAHTDQETVDRAKMTGAYGFLTKPIHHTSLTTTIEMAIHKHRADRAGRYQRAWMATVLGTMGAAIVVIDDDRKIQFLNEPAEELTGWKNDDARDRDVAMVLPLKDLASGIAANEVLSLPSDAQAAGAMPLGLIAGKRSGQWFPIEGEVSPSIDGGAVVGAVITFRDATLRQAQEIETRHQYKMQAVGRLAAGVAHDFNNLLFIILGYTEEMLGRTGFKDSERQALHGIRKAGQDASGITQKLLKFSRKEPIEKRDISLNEIIRERQEQFRRLSGASIRWHFKLDQNLGAVRAGQEQLTQILMNLAANARDAMPDGGKVTIETVNVDVPHTASAKARKSFIALIVTDTGAGMNAETAERLFEPFFTTKEPGSGTGLGLSIVHSIVTDLGGSVHVDSEPGKGATFTIYLPAAEAGTGAYASAVYPAHEGPTMGTVSGD